MFVRKLSSHLLPWYWLFALLFAQVGYVQLVLADDNDPNSDLRLSIDAVTVANAAVGAQVPEPAGLIVMLGLLIALQASWLAGDEGPNAEFAPLSTRQVTIFFTTYVLFQVWNQINCRSLTPEASGLTAFTSRASDPPRVFWFSSSA